MTVLLDAIRGHAPSFDDTVYPTDIYYHLLKRVREANSPEELGSALVHLLAWKDGKVRRDRMGPYVAYANRSYRVERTKPNTLSTRHEGVLKSEAFFTWARVIRNAEHFDATLIETLQEQFPLWTSIVLPVFVLHCLRPPIYPIVDRYVIAVFNILRPPYAAQFRPTRITVDAYEAYHQWWLQLMKEAGIQPLSAELNELKEIDSGIWALGKSISKQVKELSAFTEDEPELAAGNRYVSDGSRTVLAARGAAPLGTDSKQFKARAIALWKGGRTQADAIRVAAEEMGIALKRSYSAYPGSHFDRWRKQGFWSRHSPGGVGHDE
jgi:hypothetical protein